MSSYQSTKINVRERIVLTLVIFLVKMLKPWEYDHQFVGFWDEIKSALEMDGRPENVSGEVADKLVKHVSANAEQADNF